MSGAVGNITRKCFHSEGPLNILYVETGFYYEQLLKKTGHNFYKIPNGGKPEPIYGMNYDAILSQDRINQLPQLRHVANTVHLPIISLEHNLYPLETIQQHCGSKGTIDVTSTTMCGMVWRRQDKVIYGAVDTDQFKPAGISSDTLYWNPVFLQHFPVEQPLVQMLQGKGLRQITEFTPEKVNEIGVYLNPYAYRTNPTSMLMAMACGKPIIALNMEMWKEYVIDEVNGYLVNNIEHFNQKMELLKDKATRDRLGEAGRKLAEFKFSIKKFNKEWNKLFEQTRNHIFVGE